MNSLSESGEFSYLLLIDLDHFKNVNDPSVTILATACCKGVARLQLHVPEYCVSHALGGMNSSFVDAIWIPGRLWNATCWKYPESCSRN